MKALLLHRTGPVHEQEPLLSLDEIPVPEPGQGELLLKVSTCGVCHTELDEIEGRTPPSYFPMVLGHQVVGRIDSVGPGVTKYQTGDRIGVAWIFSSCGACPFCRAGEENLCPEFRATGRDAFGGYAEYMKVHEAFAYPVPDVFTDEEAAPLLCAGAIGFRSLRLAGLIDSDFGSGRQDILSNPQSYFGDHKSGLGLTGFGASAHLVLKMALHLWPGLKVFVFARSEKEREFARELGAVWAGDTIDVPPEKLDAIIDTTPVWKPVVEALKHLKPGGRLVINAIRKEDIDKEYLLTLSYPEHLWMEKEVKSVANVTTNDVKYFLQLAAEIPLRPEIQVYPLEEANRAILELKQQKIRGAKVLKVP